ncbi:CAAX amino terminal protease family protein [Streptococcus ictaluri 707-05]|uniref:CAAX amino terminal protease family protein n=1 Tax=Streptococcus ictaluri 707-05 TaxID=764299 RepID=G5K313_9STRE|nr:CAAX amino terminal protease family protein [Streptococcus ictaluri 707-05]
MLWDKCQSPFLQLALTTVLFTWAHSPSTLDAFLLYASLGGCLGIVRLKTDSVTASLAHLSWNSFVFALSFL